MTGLRLKNADLNKNFAAILGIYTMLFVGLYASPFSNLLKWWKKDDYSYCYLIPFIVFYLLWEKKNEFALQPLISDWRGIIAVIFGIFCYWLGELGGEYYIMYLSSWIILIGLLVLNIGMPKTRTILFPLCFILTMFPPPNFFNFKITLALKIISTKIGVKMMQIYGMSAYREGNIIDLGFTQLQVVDACSGLRYLYPMIILSILVAYYYRARLWKRAIIILSSVPLTILSNSLRIALTGILSEKFGNAIVEGFFHDFEGLLIFILTLVMLMTEIWVLKKFFPETKLIDRERIEISERSIASGAESVFAKKVFLMAPIFLLLASLGFSYGIEFREEIPMRRSFKSFPMQVAEWDGKFQSMEQRFIDTLDLTDYVMADYSDNSGKVVNFYVAYYATQRKGESIHSPATCLRGGGWRFKKSGTVEVRLKDRQMIVVNRAVIEKKPIQQISYYWFPARDRILTNAFEMKWFNFWDALTKQRTDGSLVRVIATVYPDETVVDAEKRLQAFVNDIFPVLNQYLPE